MSFLTADASGEHIVLYRAGSAAPILTQRASADHRPYIHPILAPDGVGELTENQPGHHLWQHGLYVGLNDVNGVGFWKEGYLNDAGTDGSFHPKPLAPPVIEQSSARWNVVTEWRSPDGGSMLTETQTWHLDDRGDTLVLDLEWEIRGEIDLRFGAYSYGGLFLRMPWRSETGCDILTSEGITSQTEAEGKRARWIALSMPIPGRSSGPAGVAILDHPSNPEYPSPWRVDDQGGIAPSRCIAGEWHLASGGTTVSRYRVVAYMGAIPAEAIASEWRMFADEKETNQ